MKAVYEMPHVSIEEFTPNVAIANCGDGNYTFDCLKGPNADNENLISAAMGESCRNNCGFADYSETKSGAEDTASITTRSLTVWNGERYYPVVDEGSHSNHNNTLTWENDTFWGYPYWNGKVTADANRNFLGWLYIGKSDDGYQSVGASFANGVLKLVSSATHLLLAPVYGKDAKAVQMS